MIRFTPAIFVKILLSSITFGLVSCASDVYESNTKEAHGNIATSVTVKEVKASGNENLSRGETKAPETRIIKVEGAKGDMYMRYTAAAGISGKNINTITEDESRGKMITDDNFYDDYGLFMYEYAYSDSWLNNAISSVAMPAIVNERVLKGRSWKTNELWPGMGVRLALYGYAPYNATGVSALPTALTTGKPTFHYVTPANAVNQNDLLVSEDDEYVTTLNEDGGVDVPGNYNAIKTLKFKHACTAVRIAVGDQMAPCTITKIAIKGVYGEADYNFGAGTNPNEGNWENYSPTLCDYTLTADFTVSATDQNKVINSGKYTFMLLPQIVPAGAVIEVTLDDGEQHVLKANIAGSNWEMGYSVTYFLTTSSVDEEYILLLSSPDTQVLSTGGTNTLAVQSYRQTFYGSQVAVPWTMSYNYADDNIGTTQWFGTANDVVTNATFSGTGGSTAQNTSIQIGKQVERSKPWRSTHTATLKNATEQGTASSPLDLSAGKRTANCYVVSAPGYYTFPLVYGNARNGDGSANTDSYGTGTFVDHNGVQIDNPYIYQTNGGANVPNDAFIVWQDAPHLVNPSSVKLSADKHNIEFQIEKKNICQGNSVIAVCDANGTIMWSWHIWVTDHDMNNTIEVHNNPDVGGSVISHFMEVPLGWCDAEVRVRDRRTFNFKVIQNEAGGKTSTITFEQLSADSLYEYGNNAPYYQWGRKDPMLPSNGMGNIDKPYYDNQYTPLYPIIYASNYSNNISHPYAYISGGLNSTELWNKGNMTLNYNNDNVDKTIYDPAPYLFCIPKSAAFTGFSSGTERGRTAPGNITGTFNKGYTFYTRFWQNGATFFLPALGYRNTSIISFYDGTLFWISTGDNAYGGDFVCYGSIGVYNFSRDPKELGFTILPSQY